MIKYMNTTGIMVAILALFATTVQAQFQQPPQEAPSIEVSDEELVTFIDASMKAHNVQMKSEEEMIGILDDEGLSVEAFNEIMQSVQMGEVLEDLDITLDEMEQFENASEKIEKVQEKMNIELVKAIENEGLDMMRFQEINMAIQQDPELQQRAQELLQQQQMAE